MGITSPSFNQRKEILHNNHECILSFFALHSSKDDGASVTQYFLDKQGPLASLASS